LRGVGWKDYSLGILDLLDILNALMISKAGRLTDFRACFLYTEIFSMAKTSESSSFRIFTKYASWSARSTFPKLVDRFSSTFDMIRPSKLSRVERSLPEEVWEKFWYAGRMLQHWALAAAHTKRFRPKQVSGKELRQCRLFFELGSQTRPCLRLVSTTRTACS
jgi:hypothetical protein